MVQDMMKKISELGTLDKHGARRMGIVIFFRGTKHEAKVMRLTEEERFCVHLKRYSLPIWCDTPREVVRTIAHNMATV
jgi:hypothetical protein